MSAKPAVMDFPYPPNTPGSDFKNNKGRYLRNLSPANQAFLEELQQWVAADKIDLNELSRDILDESLILLRYLRANDFNIKKTKKHMLTNIEWRRSQNIPELMAQNPEDILGCKLSDLVGHFPHWHSGYDKTGRPLLFKQQGAFDMKLIKSLCGGSFDRMFKYHVWEQEIVSRMCYEQSLRTRTIIETVTVVLDVKGMGLSSISSDFRAMMNGIVKMDQDGYPETLGKILIVNAPSVFPMIWGLIKPWLDPITAAKVSMKGSDYKDLLAENVGLENLPSSYHGSLPPLTRDVHPYAEGLTVLNGSAPVAIPIEDVAAVEAQIANLKMSAEEEAPMDASVFTRVESCATTEADETANTTPVPEPAEAEGSADVSGDVSADASAPTTDAPADAPADENAATPTDDAPAASEEATTEA